MVECIVIDLYCHRAGLSNGIGQPRETGIKWTQPAAGTRVKWTQPAAGTRVKWVDLVPLTGFSRKTDDTLLTVDID